MKEQTNAAVNNGLKNKLALGVFSIAGLTATAGMMNTLTASADDTKPVTNVNQDAQNVSAADVQQYALPQQAADSQQGAANDAVPTGKNLLPNSTLDDAVKKAQDAGINTKQVDGNTYKGTPDQYQDVLDESDSDYADQVGNILAQITDFNGYNKKLDATNGQLEDLNNLVAKAQQSGVDVNQEAQRKGLNFSEIKDDYAAQIQILQDAINQKDQKDSTIAQANHSVDQAAKAAKDAGVDVDQSADQAGDDINWTNNDAKSQVAALVAAKTKRDADMAAYNKAVQDWNNKYGNGKVASYTSEALSQALHLNAEPNATVTVNKSGDAEWTIYSGSADKPDTVSDKAVANPTYDKVVDTNGKPLLWTRVNLGQNGTATAVYTNLSNSTYRGQTISKIVKTFSYDDDSTDRNLDIDIPNDPSMDVWYNDSYDTMKNHPSAHTRALKEVDQYFDADGNQITFGPDAVITMGSLNNYTFAGSPDNGHIEMAKIDNSHFVPINNGNVTMHSDGWAYHDKDDSSNENDRKAWDQVGGDNFYKGTAVFRLNEGTKDVTIHMATKVGSKDENRWTWGQSSTLIPGGKNAEGPVYPVPAKISFHHYKSTKAVTANYHVDQLPKNDAANTINYHYNYSDITPDGNGGHGGHHDNGGNGGHHDHGDHHDNGGKHGHDHFDPAGFKHLAFDTKKGAKNSALPETAKTAASTQTISTASAYFFGISVAMSLVAAFALRRKEQ
ncbi:GbpC/Spa domain-containing protein [Eupransor demetentiae]|uniref:Membrane protein TolA involved in colicin uptake (TolA) n=1 Tax=Eupransor demetentiae TaxID=3109584 RepID=A0ABM9N421_9LACO|nr:Membrane protein TolA involved in colicin uptake (TolA) [Lactobacillaceae bacterium LMG 33000]